MSEDAGIGHIVSEDAGIGHIVSEDAGIGPRTFATLAVSGSNRSARCHPQLGQISRTNKLAFVQKKNAPVGSNQRQAGFCYFKQIKGRYL